MSFTRIDGRLMDLEWPLARFGGEGFEVKRRHFDRIGNGGIEFTELGFGSAPLGNLYKAVSDEEARAVLDAAWDSGCRYFDTAPLYGLGLAETRLNSFLRGKKRDEYVVTTKAGRFWKSASRKREPALANSLKHRRGGKFSTIPTTASCVRLKLRWRGWDSTGSKSCSPMIFVFSVMAQRQSLTSGSMSSCVRVITRCCRCATRA